METKRKDAKLTQKQTTEQLGVQILQLKFKETN